MYRLSPARSQAQAKTPGTWSPAPGDKRPSAAICCPRCGIVTVLAEVTEVRGGALRPRFTIHLNGVVTPTFACPYACRFEQGLKLDEWSANPTDYIR